ncbi:helical backbone metal receptor [Candidatus Binatia bacterium]|nr:helical backbone metal receptor [Candidatus Binatia bacterium]
MSTRHDVLPLLSEPNVTRRGAANKHARLLDCRVVPDAIPAPTAFVPGETCIDASGASIVLPRDARRIVSLVPSVTESLFALGLGERVAAVTEWCIHPADLPPPLPRVRGTKNPDVAAIVALRPDLVLANLEENREVDVRRLRERGVTVWVDYPRTVREAVLHLDGLARLGATTDVREAVVAPVRGAVERAARASTARATVHAFIAVWKDPWMTLSRDTYAHDLLACAGIRNVFADATGRYPRVELDDVAVRNPQLVLLPDEPYRFSADDAEALAHGALAGTRAARDGAVHVIDGTLAFWHGPRIAPALDLLSELAARVAEGR